MNENRTQLNEYRINQILLESKLDSKRSTDISELVSQLNIFEDIYGNSVSGNLLVSDYINILSEWPIIGQEKIQINLSNPHISETKNVNMTFNVYKVTGVTRGGQGTREYVCHFVSSEYLTNSKKSISKSYTNSTISGIAEKVFSELDTEKDFFVETTKSKYDIVIPFWKPFKALSWLAKKAISETDGSGFFFYETTDGYNFRSLEDMIGSDNNIGVTYYNTEVPDDVNQQVREMQHTSNFDMISKLENGTFSNRLLVHDMINRKITKQDYNYTEDFPKHNHLEENMIIKGEVDNLDTSPLSFQMVNTISDHTKRYSEQGFQNRLSTMQQINNTTLVITVAGNIERKAGDVVKLMIPSLGVIQDEDRLYSGKYLVSAVRHRFDSSGHEMDIEILKDSYLKPL